MKYPRPTEGFDQKAFRLPTPEYFSSFVDTDLAPYTYELLERALLRPAEDILGRSGKSIRALLVEAGYNFAAQGLRLLKEESDENLSLCKQAIELLHVGSLIIDDIQDGSHVRRGGPAIHCKYGVPNSITTGNWLYFWPLKILRAASLPTADKYRLTECFTDCLEFAHYGQILDVSVKMDELPQSKIAGVCRWVATNKTGVVTALAMQMGALCAGASEDLLTNLKTFGTRFGRCLQNFDDLGNFVGLVDREKHLEDLKERSPSFVWLCAAENLTGPGYAGFIDAVRKLPDENSLKQWISHHDFISLLTQSAERELVATLADLSSLPHSSKAIEQITQLGETIKHAYTSKPA